MMDPTQILKKPKFLPLREITLHSRPLVKRAITLSCDGELAVAADDSVHVFVPEFPDLSRQLHDQRERRRLKKKQKGDLNRLMNPSSTSSPATISLQQQTDSAVDRTGDGDRMHVDPEGETKDKEKNGDGENEEDEDEEEDGDGQMGSDLRAQYSEGSRHMPVSYPPLDPRMNRELFYNLGVVFPYDKVRKSDEDGDEDEDDDDDDDEGYGEDGGSRKKKKRGKGLGPGRKPARRSRDQDDDEDEGDDDDEDDDDDEEEDGDEVVNEDGEVISGRSNIPNRPFGAGYGPITGVGSSMNHVVCMSWSPSGLGVNRRPILGVLTGSGTLAMYGDGNTAANILPRANEGMLQHRELTSWEVLWGVGERLIVPGQQEDVTENLRGFAWAKEIGPGQALVATVNDLMEVAILSVQSVYRADQGGRTVDTGERGEGKKSSLGAPGIGENLIWLVQEVVRFEAKGPHLKGDVTDPDWIPFGTSFGLNWTPWHKTENSMTCIMSFIDRNYIGFRKITVKAPWVRGEVPQVEVDKEDIFGKCLHLSTDAFVEFENAIWSHGSTKKCRGVAVTGWKAMPFEIAMDGGASYSHQPHTPGECGTLYPDDEDAGLQNPISDLVIHAPDPANPTPTPVYTLVRTSATVKTRDWYENTMDYPDVMTDGGRSEDEDMRPQWARDIQQKVDISVPVNMQMKHGFEGDSDSEDEQESDSDDDLDEGDGYDDDDDDDDENARPAIPEIHPHRYRLHGLTVSPGGGMTAVLASHHSTQHPERGGWHTVRSTIMFGYKALQPYRSSLQGFHSTNTPTDDDDDDVDTAPLTTEGKLFEWLYGGGPTVPGVNAPKKTATATAANQPDPAGDAGEEDQDTADAKRKARLKALFQPAIDAQKCDLCGTKMTENKRGHLSGCEKGHYFGTCATSGLAVQLPGITRSCGTCGLRTIRTEMLVRKMPPEKRDEVVKAVGEGLCGGCGGKFLS